MGVFRKPAQQMDGSMASLGNHRKSNSVVTPRGRKWTAEEDLRLSEMKAAGTPPYKIAKKLDRTEAAVFWYCPFDPQCPIYDLLVS
jgi:hypothetical protein